jgi:hypothetical protein
MSNPVAGQQFRIFQQLSGSNTTQGGIARLAHPHFTEALYQRWIQIVEAGIGMQFSGEVRP